VGVIGRYSRRVANDTVTDADMVFAVGTRFGGLATNAWQLPFSQKRLLQLDADPQVIGQNFRVEYSLVGDAKLTLAAVVAEVKARGAARGRTPWAKSVMAKLATWKAAAKEMATAKPADGMHPAEVVAALRTVMKPDDLLAADTGAIAAWAGTLFPTPAGRFMLRSTGSLGWVVPGALGAALAAPQRKTVALSGDGGLLYHIGELETAIRCKIPLMIVVVNNRSFASEFHLQKRGKHSRIIPEVIDFSDADFGAIARGFGAHGVRVTQSDELLPALREAYALGKPALVDVICSKETAAPSASYRGDSLV
jgi:acetolactate synthase I/II/III large subunit